MKIMLVNPPNCGRSIPEEEYGITSLKQLFKGEPFSLEVLAGPLQEHDVMIFDLKCESDEAFWAAFESFAPDVVGFTAVTCEANTVISIACKIKEKSNPVVVIGGNHATYSPEYFNRPEFDYIVIGLGKKSFSELISRLAAGNKANGIAGIAKVSPGKPLAYVVRNYDKTDLMDNIPPRYDLVAKYRHQYFLEQLGLTMGFVISAYGCTHKCSFCSIPQMAGGKYLNYSANAVVRDIQLLNDIPFIRMVDANTFGNPAHSQELYEKITRAGIKKKIFADVRADTVVKHPALMKNWKEAGLYAVVVGFEDIADVRLAAYNKKYQGHVIHEAIDILHNLGIVIIGDFIASPEDDEADFEKLEKFIIANKIEIPVISILTPIPGTPLYKKMEKDIIVSDLDYYTFTNAVTATKMPEDLFYKTFADLVKRLHNKPHRPQ
ncbi:MAG: B12-binding domain-containing radical SAM protein [Deltaproteobacteria bacterium RBG_19FT_COMBO_43_11]|nr:MAG: B12-binding domain-containing radical SAM protein [Deltaproteobacteria bacterium RBG_19FT_COMBO_43_11]